MSRASALGLFTAALACASTAIAGSAPATSYPSLGYDQIPPAEQPPADPEVSRHDEVAYLERLPDSFFAGSGGVGAADVSGDGGAVYVRGFAVSSASGSARASARVGSRMSVVIHKLSRSCGCGR